MSQFQARPWSDFSPPPLTVLSPDGAALANPPFLHWVAMPGAARYRVTLSGRGSELAVETHRNFLTPARPLPDGYHRLEVTPLDPGGNPLAPPAVADVRVPAPDGEPPGDLNAVVRVPGAPLLAGDSEVEAIWKAGGARAGHRDLLLEIVRRGDSSLITPVHETGTDGAPILTGTLSEPERYPGYWDFDTWHENNHYCFTVEDAILAATLAWRLTEEGAFADEAVRLMREVAAWDPVGATGVWENDHSAQALLHALALGYDTLRAAMSAGDRTAIAACIAARCEDIHGLLNPFCPKDLSCGPMNNPDNNHPWFVASAMGIGALALSGEDPRADDWAAFAAQIFAGFFLPRGGVTGAWHEGVDYWAYTLFFVFQFADALRNATGVDLYRRPWLTRTLPFKVHCHPPAGAWVPFGDCKHQPPGMIDKVTVMRLASAHGDPLGWEYADRVAAPVNTARMLFHAVLWGGRAGGDGKAVPETPAVRHYHDIGWVVAARDLMDAGNQRLFAFRCGPARPHGHADQNSFVLCAGGDRLLWDAGYYDSYFSPHHRDYSRHSAAHNTVLVDGEGQLVNLPGLDGTITRFAENEGFLSVEGDCSNQLLYRGRLAKFVRRAELRGFEELVVEDDLEVCGAARLSFLLHSVFPIVYDPGARAIRIRGERFGLRMHFESAVPVEALVTSTFPVAPGLVSRVLADAADYRDQYHLELRTVAPVTAWRPRLVARIVSVA